MADTRTTGTALLPPDRITTWYSWGYRDGALGLTPSANAGVLAQFSRAYDEGYQRGQADRQAA